MQLKTCAGNKLGYIHVDHYLTKGHFPCFITLTCIMSILSHSYNFKEVS